MTPSKRSPARVAFPFLAPATAALAAVVFIADTISKTDIAVAALYAAVVLLSARFCRPRLVVGVALGCTALIILSYRLSPPAGPESEAVINSVISIAVVGFTTVLALQGQSDQVRLREQASLLDLTHDTIFVRGMDDVITYWNRGAEELYGWSPEEAVGRVAHRLLQTRFPAALEEINATLVRTSRWEGQLIHTHRDGTRLTVSSRWALQRDEQGRPAIILETNNDITERTRAEERLRESEEQWKAVFEHNPTMFFMVDAAGVTLSVNPFGAEQLGYRVEELVGRPVKYLFHEQDREAALRNAAACFEHPGRTSSWELRKVRKNGQMIWVRETAKAMHLKDRPVVLIVCEDITERKEAEYLTGHVFELSPDGMCVIGSDYRYQRVNPVYARIWGKPAEAIIGKPVVELVGPEIFEQTGRANLARCFAGEDVTYVGWITYPHGRRFLAQSYSPLRPYSERVDAALVIARDLTEHMLATEALQDARADLAHVNRVATMGQLTASIAHEVSQPVAAAVMNAKAALRWLAADPPNLTEVRQALDRIVENGGRVSDVIGRIRAVIKKTPHRETVFDVNEAVRDVIALTRSEAEKCGVSVETGLATELPAVEGDRIQLQQVVLNLIMNALEAVCGAEAERREIRVSTEGDPEGGVLVAVRDSGPGLDPQNAERLFEAFYTTKAEGMGMGLAICRSIVHAHGGRLWASANEPHGAVFQFALPVQRAQLKPLPAMGGVSRS